MDSAPIPEGHSQADLIKDLNFDVDPEDPLTKAALEDHPEDAQIDILGNGQLKKKTITKGKKGFRPNRYDMCKLKISGKLVDSDKTVEVDVEKTIQLGDAEVVQGLDLAIALMEVGELAEIEVASRFAYGDTGLPPDVPPGATILYTVELKSMEPEKDVEELDFQLRKEIGNKKRERGNWWFSRDEPTLAIQCYRRSLDFLNPTKNVTTGGPGAGEPDSTHGISEESPSDSDLQALLEARTKVYNNLAAAQIKIEAYDAALESVENVLRCQPQNVKALFRKGKILHKKGQHAIAHATLLQAAKFDPESKVILQELAILKEKTARDTLDEKKLYRKMLGTPKGEQNQTSTMNNDTKVDNNSKISGKIAAWSLFGGAVAAAAGVIAYRFIF